MVILGVVVAVDILVKDDFAVSAENDLSKEADHAGLFVRNATGDEGEKRFGKEAVDVFRRFEGVRGFGEFRGDDGGIEFIVSRVGGAVTGTWGSEHAATMTVVGGEGTARRISDGLSGAGFHFVTFRVGEIDTRTPGVFSEVCERKEVAGEGMRMYVIRRELT